MRTLVASGLALLACAALAVPAGARVSTATTVDGPSPDVVDVGDVAMSEDGTGGVVYRKRVDGAVHVFAAQFAGGEWRPPQRVDAGQRFDSSWPAIGAGDGGRLVVSWVQESGAADRMWAATLSRGGRRFGPPVPVDLNVGEPIAVFPSLAMSRGGAAYLSYVVAREDPAVPTGFVRGELRVARFGGQFWSTFGFPLNRNPSSPIVRPTEQTGPEVTIDTTGAGLVTWQEPDDDLVPRIWTRRLFGSTPGLPLLVSPQRLRDTAVRGGADAFSVDQAGFGQAAIAFRQQAGPGSPFAGTRLFVSTLAESFQADAGVVSAPRLVDGRPEGEAPGTPGAPDVAAVPGGGFVTAFGVGTQAFVTADQGAGVGELQRIDDGTSTVTTTPLTDVSEAGASVFAVRRLARNRGAVVLREVRTDGIEETRALSTPRGGAIGTMRLAGSGLGDAITGFQQGERDLAQVAVGVVDAPPEEFAVETPPDFIRPRDLLVRWQRPDNAIGELRYAFTLDDETLAEDLERPRFPLPEARLEDGVVIVQVIATDAAGQETSSFPAELQVDGTAPRTQVRATRRGRRVRVRVADGRKGRVAGLDRFGVRISFGDGARVRGRARASHVYRRAGTYTVATTATDLAGNRRTVRRRVRVR